MKVKKTIKKVIVLSAWLIVAGGITTLLVAANQKHQGQVCKDVVVSIKGAGEKFYVEKNEILGQLKRGAGGSLINESIETIDLSKLEKVLKSHLWIKAAELYFDSRDVLHVQVVERNPIARVFTTTGESFYIDNEGERMPLIDKITVRLPVVTNFTAAKKLNKADSSLLLSLVQVVQVIINDDFWNAQVAQIDITADERFELIPVVGNHTIKIGTVDNIENKLSNVLLFYKQVLSKVGVDKYKVIDAQYKDQIVGVQKAMPSPVDSIQLKKNIEELMNQNQVLITDEKIEKAGTALNNTPATAVNISNPNPVKAENVDPVSVNKPNPISVKATLPSKPSEKVAERKPKAIMNKKLN